MYKYVNLFVQNTVIATVGIYDTCGRLPIVINDVVFMVVNYPDFLWLIEEYLKKESLFKEWSEQQSQEEQDDWTTDIRKKSFLHNQKRVSFLKDSEV